MFDHWSIGAGLRACMGRFGEEAGKETGQAPSSESRSQASRPGRHPGLESSSGKAPMMEGTYPAQPVLGASQKGAGRGISLKEAPPPRSSGMDGFRSPSHSPISSRSGQPSPDRHPNRCLQFCCKLDESKFQLDSRCWNGPGIPRGCPGRGIGAIDPTAGENSCIAGEGAVRYCPGRAQRNRRVARLRGGFTPRRSPHDRHPL